MTKSKAKSLDEIAAKCGVSKMTISRALRNDAGVSEATRDMVMRVAQEVNYFPSKSRKPASIECPRRYYILFKSDYTENGTFFSELILSLQQEIFAEGASCSLGMINHDYPEFLRLLQMMQAEEVDGAFVVGDAPIDYLEALLRTFANIVFVDYPGDPRLRTNYKAVVFDNVNGSYIATQHLLEIGRKRILLIHGPKNHYFSRAMRIGYSDALSDHGLEVDPELMIAADFRLQGGKLAVEQAIDNGIEFDAIFSNDIMACGTIAALQDRGMRVPEDVSVAGFDGLAVGEAIRPALTTVIADREKMGKLAVQKIRELEDGAGEEDRFVKLYIFPELVVRQSCGGQAVDRAPKGVDPAMTPVIRRTE